MHIRGVTDLFIDCRSFECASTSSGVHDWEDQFGCASPFDVNPAAWDISSGASFVSSIYQLPVMIVEATVQSIPRILIGENMLSR